MKHRNLRCISVRVGTGCIGIGSILVPVLGTQPYLTPGHKNMTRLEEILIISLLSAKHGFTWYRLESHHSQQSIIVQSSALCWERTPLPSHLLQEGQGQHAPPLDVVRVLHTHQTGARVVRVRVAVADLGLQLVQVKGAIGEVGHSGGVNPSKLWGGHERAE